MMNTHTDKTQENNSQSVAGEISLKQNSSESFFQFVENRPETVVQRKLQEMAKNSPGVTRQRIFQEIANNSPQATQAAQFQSIADTFAAQHPIQTRENKTVLQRRMRPIMKKLDTSPRSSPIQRNIQTGHLNLVGEEHDKTDERIENEKKMIEEMGFNKENYWDETNFTYMINEQEKHGDPPKQRLAYEVTNQIGWMEDLKDELESVKLNSNNPNIYAGHIEKMMDYLTLVKKSLDQIEWEFKYWQEEEEELEAHTNTGQYLHLIKEEYSKLKKGILDKGEMKLKLQYIIGSDSIKISEIYWEEILKALNYEGKSQEEIKKDRSDSMVGAASNKITNSEGDAKEGEDGVWMIGNSHIGDIRVDDFEEDAFNEMNLTTTSDTEFESLWESSSWKNKMKGPEREGDKVEGE